VRAVREGRQREFAEAGWSAGAPDPFDDVTFASARLDWSELVAEPHRRALDWYRSLLALRRQWPELSDGRLDRVVAHADEDGGVFTAERGRLRLVAALRDGRFDVDVPKEAELLLASDEHATVVDSTLCLAGPAAAVLVVG
jgi:maltooligosyltrehalose trehalohydrolase